MLLPLLPCMPHPHLYQTTPLSGSAGEHFPVQRTSQPPACIKTQTVQGR